MEGRRTLPQTLKSAVDLNQVSSMYVAASWGCMRWLCRRGVTRQYRSSHTRRKPANLSTCTNVQWVFVSKMGVEGSAWAISCKTASPVWRLQGVTPLLALCSCSKPLHVTNSLQVALQGG